MKKTFLAVALLLSASAVNFAVANNDKKASEVREGSNLELNLETLNNLKFKLSINNLPNRSYIAIKNADGNVLYSEYAGKSEQFTKVFDLSNLLDGNYTFVVDTTNGHVEKPFEIKTEVTRVVTAVK
ncbi:hypothetical protein GCM10027275_41830 [Rhabdobacter roseus]|uniref:Por secretion system C-terminal sorting domain-containing protein n=1 Tax=Rhabdobacter roseus TaxID=1655419 RepID=A0A840TQN1_9BACT|nr:hypothetical protein [Rhabdobacter roseus]MBB5286161.1 hypothetical protein [Rhabdobacter roseus]